MITWEFAQSPHSGSPKEIAGVPAEEVPSVSLQAPEASATTEEICLEEGPGGSLKEAEESSEEEACPDFAEKQNEDSIENFENLSLSVEPSEKDRSTTDEGLCDKEESNPNVKLSCETLVDVTVRSKFFRMCTKLCMTNHETR